MRLEIHPCPNGQPGWIATAELIGNYHQQGFEEVADRPAAERRAKEMAREIIEREIVRLMNLREALRP